MNQEKECGLNLGQVQTTQDLSHSQMHSNLKYVSKWYPMYPKGMKYNVWHKIWSDQEARMDTSQGYKFSTQNALISNIVWNYGLKELRFKILVCLELSLI